VLPAITVWEGRYMCPQGVTAVELTLERGLTTPDTGETSVDAVFTFGPHVGNPGLPTGSYRMTGQISAVAGELVVSLQPDAWITRPLTYEMVSVQATIDRDQRRLVGTIGSPRCSWIEANRR
jgi:hypothetical protein